MIIDHSDDDYNTHDGGMKRWFNKLLYFVQIIIFKLNVLDILHYMIHDMVLEAYLCNKTTTSEQCEH